MRWRVCSALLLFVFGASASADIFRPAYLEVREVGDDVYDVLWKVPALGNDQRLSAYVVFPPGTINASEPHAVISNGAWIERWQIHRDGGLEGGTISITGSAAGVTDIVARIERLDGSSQVEALVAARPEFVVRPPPGKAEIAWSYLGLGVEHILGGIDHLLFVLALLLIVRNSLRIVATVTAFTLAHSITLVSATLGWMFVPGPPVEAIIALSIVFVAAEIVHGVRGKPGLTARAPWLVAFSFGLLHGFGFAGALAEVGLPQHAIPIALLMFNVGVEIGQLLFVMAMLLLGRALAPLTFSRQAWPLLSLAYGIGGVAAFWTIERVASFWP